MFKSERQKMKEININSDWSSSDDLSRKSPIEPELLSNQQENDAEADDISKVNDMNEFQNTEESEMEGKLYLINKMLDSKRQRTKQLNINSDRSGLNNLNVKIPNDIELLLNQQENEKVMSKFKINDIKELENIEENEMEDTFNSIDKMIETETQFQKMEQLNTNSVWLGSDEILSDSSDKTYIVNTFNAKGDNADKLDDYDLFENHKNDTESNSYKLPETDDVTNERFRVEKMITKFSDVELSNEHDKNAENVKNMYNSETLSLDNENIVETVENSVENTMFAMVLNKKRREQQIKNVYVKGGLKPALKQESANISVGNISSSSIRRKIQSKEIARENKIIAQKILNARSTIPKAK